MTKGDATSLPFPASSFDVVTSVNVLFNLENPKKAILLLSGGIDSSIIASLVKKHHNNDLITFSVAFNELQ